MPDIYLQEDAIQDGRFIVHVVGQSPLGYLLQRDSGEVEVSLAEDEPLTGRVFPSLQEALEAIEQRFAE